MLEERRGSSRIMTRGDGESRVGCKDCPQELDKFHDTKEGRVDCRGRLQRVTTGETQETIIQTS